MTDNNTSLLAAIAALEAMNLRKTAMIGSLCKVVRELVNVKGVPGHMKGRANRALNMAEAVESDLEKALFGVSWSRRIVLAEFIETNFGSFRELCADNKMDAEEAASFIDDLRAIEPEQGVTG